MMKKNLIRGGIAILVLIGIMIPVFLKEEKVEITAHNETFNGIKNLIEASTAENPFTIVELVPHISYAKLGYLVDGEEPINWRKEIVKYTSFAERDRLMKALADDFAFISGGPDQVLTKLNNGVYEEQYFPAEGFEKLSLIDPIILSKNEQGYKMVPKTLGGHGYYSIEENYTFAEDGYTGTKYKQNIKYFTYSNFNGHYKIKFKKADGQPNDLAAKQVYISFDSIGLTSAEDLRGVPDSTAIYEIETDNDDDDDSDDDDDDDDDEKPYFKFVNFKADFTKTDYIVNGKSKYYFVKFQKVEADHVTANPKKVYYEVDGEAVFDMTKKSEYDGVLVPGAGYVEDAGGRFKKNIGEKYSFVEDGSGNYNLERSATETLNADVEFQHFFVKGGFKNNDLFKKEVFLKDDYAAKKDQMKIKVLPMTPGELDLYLSNNKKIDLLYFSNSRLPFSAGEENAIPYSHTNNIKEDTLRILAELIKSQVEVEKDGKKVMVKKEGKILPLILEPSVRLIPDDLRVKRLFSDYKTGEFIGGQQVVRNVLLLDSHTDLKKPAVLVDFMKNITDNASSIETFLEIAKAHGASEVANQIVEENNDKLIFEENPTQWDLEITRATLLEYIISYQMKKIKTTDGEIRVLNIEPAPQLEKDEENFRKKQVKRVEGWFKDTNYKLTKISVDTISTTQLVGQVTEFSDYDMIYFGLDTSRFNMAGGKTDYNDNTMDGLIYSNIGDLCITIHGTYNAHGGLLDTDYLKNKDYFKELNENQKIAERNYFLRSLNLNSLNDEGYVFVERELRNKFRVGSTEYTVWNGKSKLNYTEPNMNRPDIKELPNTYRFSGNDISLDNQKKLQEFISGGYPIILAEGFLKEAGGAYKVNPDKIDNCSRMYDLIHNNLNAKNIFFEKKASDTRVYNLKTKNIGTGLLHAMLNTTRPEIIISENSFETSFTAEGEPPLKHTITDNNTLVIKFRLENKGVRDPNIKFKAELFIDVNSDGKFSAKQEKVGNKSLVITKGNGSKIKNNELVASDDVTYVLRNEFPEDYIGVIPWKLKISMADNERKFTTGTGYGYIKRKAGNKKEINVLQIKAAKFTDIATSTDYFSNGMSTILNWSGQDNFDMATNQEFKRLIAKVKDYKINVVSITARQYADYYKAYTDASAENRNTPVNVYQKMSHFGAAGNEKKVDMIVLGFSDCYSITNLHNCLVPLQEFIKDGNPVLFTHDCTSFINYIRSSPWGYDFNKMIRDLVGLDRYGIEDTWAMKLGETVEKNSNAVFRKEIYPTLMKQNSPRDYKSRELFTVIENKATSSNAKKIKDVAYEPKSGKTRIVRQAQGLSNGTLMLNSRATPKFIYNDGSSKPQQETNMIRRINKGQITDYPFKIKDSMAIVKTHVQPYQLDFNEDADLDGESDLIVWYTLEEDNYGFDRNKALYYCTPRDARNNYYIYTKGNITYSGVGHAKFAGNNEEEIKLYINTMITAYNAAIDAPKVEFRDNFDEDGEQKFVSYVSINDNEHQAGEEYLDQFVDVYFHLKDTNVIKNLYEKNVKVMIELSNGDRFDKLNYSVLDKDSRAFSPRVDDPDWLVLNNLESYHLQIPKDALNFGDKNFVKVRLTAKTVFRRTRVDGTPNSKYEETPQAVAEFTIQKRTLFDLD